MDKETRVDFSEEAHAAYRELQSTVLREKEEGKNNSFHAQLLKSIEREKDNLKINPQHGTPPLQKRHGRAPV